MQVSHARAWHSPARSPDDRGERFSLTDCIVWMRLMFLAGRETGLAEHTVFWQFFQGFLGHFIAVYERSAPPHTRAAARWSQDSKRVEQYREAGCYMEDICS